MMIGSLKFHFQLTRSRKLLQRLFFMKIDDVFSNERNVLKGFFFSKQPSYALCALIGRFQIYLRCQTFQLSCKILVRINCNVDVTILQRTCARAYDISKTFFLSLNILVQWNLSLSNEVLYRKEVIYVPLINCAWFEGGERAGCCQKGTELRMRSNYVLNVSP